MVKKKKNILKKIKLQISAGQANPAPPIGPILGQAGINIMEFCKDFNEQTKQSKGMVVSVALNVYEDRSFDFQIKSPPAAELIKKTIKIEKGSANSKKEPVGTLSLTQLEEIAKIKLPDINAKDLEGAKKIVTGTARSMGVNIAAS